MFSRSIAVCAAAASLGMTTLSLASTPVSARAAARILEQSTFGPTSALISQVEDEGFEGYLANQFAQPASLFPALSTPLPSYCTGGGSLCIDYDFWKIAMTGNDQLRQRIAFALGEIFVVSGNTDVEIAFPYYLNILSRDSFANWSTIMHDVTLSPAMGAYLNMLDSAKAPSGQVANENFARESMQLFSLGINKLNLDGTEVLDAHGRPEPNYSEAEIEAFARAYTGWTFANSNGTQPAFLLPYSKSNWNTAMVPVEAFHDTSSKKLLNGTVLPAGQDAEADLAGAISNIFENPSLPPFICKQLIQHLVTSNPSPEYVTRVSEAFVNNGNGVRGDMKAVVTAILLDPEARAGDVETSNPAASFGHLREPVLWLTSVFRGLGATAHVSDPSAFESMNWFASMLTEHVHNAPSVFSFFPPSNQLADSSLLAPEFGLENTATVFERESLADWIDRNCRTGNLSSDLSAGSPLGRLSAKNVQSLLDQLNLVFMHGSMSSQMNKTILDAIIPIEDPALRVRLAVFLIVSSPQYKIYS